MARCGRCGLWYTYPADSREQAYAGTCLWYQIRLPTDSVYDKRRCPDFFEALKGVEPMEQLSYKIQRDALGEGFRKDLHSRRVAYTSLVISLGGFLYKMISLLREA